jgi:SAM-dependent methyltransferase
MMLFEKQPAGANVTSFSQLMTDLRSKGLPIVIELGPGNSKTYPHSIGIDLIKKDSVDYVWDLRDGLSFIGDNEVDLIFSSHFLEHIDQLEPFLKEVHRVLKPGGRKIGIVPHFSNPYYYSDYTHKNFWGLYTILYFSQDRFFQRDVPRYYNSLDFRINAVKLIFRSPFSGRMAMKRIFGAVVNCSKYAMEFYEENLTGLCQCYEIRFEIEKK